MSRFVVEQLLRYGRALRIGPHEYGDVSGCEAPALQIFDRADQQRRIRLLALLVFSYGHVSRFARFAAPLPLVSVCFREHVAQFVAPPGRKTAVFGRFLYHPVQAVVVELHACFDQAVVELDDRLFASVVRVERRGPRVFEPRGDLTAQNPPVSAPPAVDRLLDVAHQQHRFVLGLRDRVFEQRDEIAPLTLRSVLKLVDHETGERIADLLVDKRRVVVSHQLAEDRVGFRNRYQVLLRADFGYFLRQVVEQREAAVVGREQPGRIQEADVVVVDRAELGQQSSEGRHDAPCRFFPGASGRNPFFLRFEGVEHSLAVGGDRSVGRLDEIADASASAVGEVFGGQSGRIDDGQSLGRRFFHFVFDPAAPGDCRRNDARQLFARCLVAGCRAVSFSEQLAAQLRNFAADVPAAVRVDLFLHEVQHPVAQRAVDGDAVDQPVRRAVEDRIRLELQIEVQIDPEFLDERADDPLEKLVDRQDRKTAVVVQYLRARVRRAPADRLSVEPQIAFQIAHVAARTAVGQRVEFSDDTLLHFFGGLVRERDGQNVAVQLRRIDHAAYVFVSQPVGFSRSGRGFQYFHFSHVTKGN